MQKEPDDINNMIDEQDINEMQERRIDELSKNGIDEEQVLTRAHKNLNTWMSYFGDNVSQGKADLEFVVKNQWSQQERADFSRLQKPALTFNKLYDTTKKILGEQRKNKPNLMVRSLNGKIEQEQLDLRTDLVRTFAYQSQNDMVYQSAFKSALMMGWGAFQIGIKFESPYSFNKTIEFQSIVDPTRCAWDPTALKPHKGDGNFCARTFTMTRDEFFATYPYITNPVSFVDPYMLVDYQWQTRDTIAICDQYVKEWYPLTAVQLSNGMSVSESQWEEAQKVYQKQQDLVEGSIISRIIQNGIPHVKAKRQTEDYRVMRYLMLRDCIIDFEEFPSKHLPIIFVDGDSYFENGRQFTKSFIHEAKDAQRCINYFGSEIAAEIKNRRREQWLGTAENITGYEQIWRNPEVQVGMLPARPDPKTGQMPQKQMAWGMAPELIQNMQRSTQDVKEILGFSEQEVIQSRDLSGKARRERKLEGGLAAYIFFDNLNQSIAQAGRIVNDLLREVIGTDERYLPVTKSDGKTSTVIFNHAQKDGNVKNTLNEGDYDIEIDAGPSFAVQKEIALEFLQQTASMNPQAFSLIADLWAKNLDVEFMPQMVERLKNLVPPQILAKESGEPMPPQPPNPQEMMAQHQMMMQQQEMKNKQAELAMKQQQIQMDAKQHLMDQMRLKNDAIEMLGKLQNDKEKIGIDKGHLIAELTKIISDAGDKHAKNQLDLHKTHLQTATNLLTTLQSAPGSGQNDLNQQ
jgi:hypothetical protein